MPGTPPPTSATQRLLPWLERHGILLLVGYFLLMGLLRPLISSALEFDEAEQMLHTQRLLLGYGAQPPLFTWLLYGLFALDGPSLLALALLKNGLMFLSTLFLFLASRRILGSDLPALAVSLSFLLIPQFAWESQRIFTHSVVLTTCAVAAFYLLVRVQQEGRLADYAGLGLALGLGALSKYSFALHAILLLGAALLTPALRGVLLDRRILLTLIIAAVLTLPHGLWLLEHWEAAFAPTMDKLHVASDSNLLTTFFTGWGSLAWSAFLFLTPLWMVYLWAARAPREDAPAPDTIWRAFFLRYGLLFVIGMSLFILLAQATSFRDRWLQPFLVLAPLAALLLWPMGRAGARRLIAASLVLMALAFVLLNTRVLLGGMLDKPSKVNLPIEQIAERLRAQGWTRGLILAENMQVAGDLKLQLPESTVLKTGLALIPDAELRRECEVLLAWDKPNQPEPPAELSAAFMSLYGRAWIELPHEHAAISAPMLHGKRIYTLHTLHIRQACTS